MQCLESNHFIIIILYDQNFSTFHLFHCYLLANGIGPYLVSLPPLFSTYNQSILQEAFREVF